jgi:hypothetical protein
MKSFGFNFRRAQNPNFHFFHKIFDFLYVDVSCPRSNSDRDRSLPDTGHSGFLASLLCPWSCRDERHFDANREHEARIAVVCVIEGRQADL